MAKFTWLIAAAFAGMVAFGLFLLANWYLHEERIQLPPMEDYDQQSIPWVTPGIINPKTDPADTDKVQPNEKVIGVVFQDQARAYLLSAMDHQERTVVNDVIQGIPVSVTYYPMDSVENEPQKRIRVFTDPRGSKALMMGLAGTEEGKMMIFCGETQYLQMGSEIPVWHDANEDGKKQKDEMHVLEDIEFEVLTWNEWKKRYPETDIFRGIGMRGETPPNL